MQYYLISPMPEGSFAGSASESVDIRRNVDGHQIEERPLYLEVSFFRDCHQKIQFRIFFMS